MSEQAVIEQIENAVDDVVETVVPEVVETVTVVRNNPVLLMGVAVVAASAGAFVGYKVAEKRLSLKFETMVEEEVEATRQYYMTFNKEGYPTPEAAAEALIPADEREAHEAFMQYSGAKPTLTVVEEEVEVVKTEVTENADGDEVEVVEEVKHNIFLDGKPVDETFDYDAEVSKRSEDHPYVITEEEFFENQPEYDQWTCTYYEGDDTLVDEGDRVIHDAEAYVGNENLKRFGHGSKDKNLVYIRNNKRGLDFEIARSRGKYTKEVLGLDDEDERQEPRRFRGGDE